MCQNFGTKQQENLTEISPHGFPRSTDSFRQKKKSTFSSFPVGASLPHVAREMVSAGPL